MPVILFDTIVLRRCAALIPYARNARTHSDQQVAQIAASIREFGFTNPSHPYSWTGLRWVPTLPTLRSRVFAPGLSMPAPIHPARWAAAAAGQIGTMRSAISSVERR